jgi:very-short-patch-repair endonuclease
MTNKKGHPAWNKNMKFKYKPNYKLRGRIPWNKDLTKETDERIKLMSMKGNDKKSKSHINMKYTKEHKLAISRGLKGKSKSISHVINQRKTMKRLFSEKIIIPYERTDKIRKKARLNAINFIKINNKEFTPNIGKHETQILDELELSNNLKLIRQYEVDGYFVDGYCKDLNLVIEVDERLKCRDKDIRREKYIKKKLNCKFLRIRDNFNNGK